MAAPKRSSFGTRLLMNFLTYHGIYLKICDNWKWKQAVVGQSDSRFCTNMKKNGYFLACTAVVMLKIEARPGCTRTKGYISRKQRRTKKVTSKLEQGLNFTVNGDFWFCNDDFLKKWMNEIKRRDWVILFSPRNKHCSFYPKVGSYLENLWRHVPWKEACAVWRMQTSSVKREQQKWSGAHAIRTV